MSGGEYGVEYGGRGRFGGLLDAARDLIARLFRR